MDFASLATAASSIGTAISTAKAALEIRDFNATGAAIAEMTQKLLDLQSQLLAVNAAFFQLQQERVALTEQVRELEKERTERERYTLFEISPGAFVYRFNVSPEADGATQPGIAQPAHYLCQRCFDEDRKVVLQNWSDRWRCTHCNISFGRGSTLDVSVVTTGPGHSSRWHDY
ncbi:hypothetical protein [Stenotrophomonas sp.]|uniref:hypothetical protein n=1 Tax=Stenotrophomonas sp. TaxID=69392 RepID=UPI0028A83DA6|nr:hypothetical protein [Stenotrophomonas sp.]